MQKILIVDDEPSIRKLYQNTLEKEGYRVLMADSGEAALEELQATTPDLIILDIKMDKMDGIDCLRSIVESKRNIPVILNSAYSSYKRDFSSWLADAYLVKSSDLTPLKEKVKELLGR
jgi:DNA-binding response OmpR family regulator